MYFGTANVELNNVKLTKYTKYFSTEINAKNCRIKHKRNSFYRRLDDCTGMGIEQSQVTSDIDPTPQQCNQASGGRSLTLFVGKLNFEEGMKESHQKSDGNAYGEHDNACCL